MDKNNIPRAAVAIIFFNRPDTLAKVFEAVREEKPPKLFLIQDGARANNANDAEKIAKCREVVANVDWDCEVVREHSDVNLGCGKRVFSGVSKAFETEDRLIIIEDDIVVTPDFFRFCNELLEKYKDDERIHRISGMCHMGEYKKNPYSYGFTNISSCWGWATWKRAWNDMDYEMSFMEDTYAMECFRKNYRYKNDAKTFVKRGEDRRKILLNGGRLTAWTYQFSMGGRLNNRLDITPTKNLITCIGLTDDSGHASNSIKKIAKGLQPVFFGKTYPMDTPIKHPRYIMEDVDMEKAIINIMGWTPWLKFTRKIESIARQVIFADKGDLGKLFNKLLKKLRIK